MTLTISPRTLTELRAVSQTDEDRIAGRDVLVVHTDEGTFQFRLVCEFQPAPIEYVDIEVKA